MHIYFYVIDSKTYMQATSNNALSAPLKPLLILILFNFFLWCWLMTSHSSGYDTRLANLCHHESLSFLFKPERNLCQFGGPMHFIITHLEIQISWKSRKYITPDVQIGTIFSFSFFFCDIFEFLGTIRTYKCWLYNYISVGYYINQE